MSNAPSSTDPESNELDFSDHLGDEGEGFDILMTNQQPDMPATAPDSLAIAMEAVPNEKDEWPARRDDFTTVYNGYNQNASGTTNPTIASVIDPLLLMDGHSTSGWEWDSSRAHEPRAWLPVPEYSSLNRMFSQAPALTKTRSVNHDNNGTSSRIVQPLSNKSSHTPLNAELPLQPTTTRFHSNLPVTQIAFVEGDYDGKYGSQSNYGNQNISGRGWRSQPEGIYWPESFGDALSSNLGTTTQASPTYVPTSDTEFWQPALYQYHFNIESPTSQQQRFVEGNSFEGVGYAQVNDGSPSPSVNNTHVNTAQQAQQIPTIPHPEWPDLTRECCLLFPTRAKLPKVLEYEQDNGADWISPITGNRTKKVDFLSRGLDYQAIKKNASLLVVSEIKGAELVSDLIPRLDPNTIPDKSKAVLKKAKNAKVAEVAKLRAQLIRKLRNNLSNLKRRFRRRLEMGMALDFRPGKPGKAKDGIKSTEAADRTLNRRVPLTAENFFHNTPYQVCHSTKSFRAPLRVNDNGDVVWTDYPLEPARRLTEKARNVLRNVGINEPDFDQYLQQHVEYRTWRPDRDHSYWKPEYRILGPPDWALSSLASAHNRKMPVTNKRTGWKSLQTTRRQRQLQGIAAAQSIIKPPTTLLQDPNHPGSKLKQSFSEARPENSGIVVDGEVKDRPRKKMRLSRLS